MTSEWENAVLQIIHQADGRTFGLVDDPDSVLSGEVLYCLVAEGWQVIRCGSPLELRLEYERSIRKNKASRLLFLPGFSFDRVPADISRSGIAINLSLQTFFPRLNSHVLRELPIEWRAVIYKNQPGVGHVRLSELETARFILQSCLGIEFPDAPGFTDYLELLANLVFHHLKIPSVLFTALFPSGHDQNASFFRPLLESPQIGLSFLQRVWAAYVSAFVTGKSAISDRGSDDTTQAVLSLAASRDLQAHFTALLADNILTPAEIQPESHPPAWLRQELHYFRDPSEGFLQRIKSLSQNLPGDTARTSDWISFAQAWAIYRVDYLQTAVPRKVVEEANAELQEKIEEAFGAWLKEQYPALLQQPYLPFPTMVHQVLSYLASRFQPSTQRPLALVIMDGMAMEDWVLLRTGLEKLDLSGQINEGALFAFVPTLTSISRQALLSGRLPSHFVENWLGTESEDHGWRLFWQEKGFQTRNISYLRGLGKLTRTDARLEPHLEALLSEPHLAVGALVINALDELIHTSLLGSEALHRQIRLWSREGYLNSLVTRLLDRFSTIIITADHGHVEGKGIGDLPDSRFASERALRARIFRGVEYATAFASREDVIQWPGDGLPEGYVVGIPRSTGLFTKIGERGISHGGITLEEVIVPFVILNGTMKPQK